MKILFVSINSKYIHTLLAPRYLIANCKAEDMSVFETNINVPLNETVSSVYSIKPDIIAISTYIFNTAYVERFLAEIRKVLPNSVLIVGGWEAAARVEHFLNLADFIIRGEGETVFSRLITDIENGQANERIIDGGEIECLDALNSPYTDEYARIGKEKILYFESSRGCPFSCSYCMSGKRGQVRTFSLDRVFSDLEKITRYNPSLVKFVDRTFNFDVNRAASILTHIVNNYSNSNTCFHFELSPELFSAELLNIIKHAKKGLFQFEIGVQTYNERALAAIRRRADLEKVDKNIKTLIDQQNANIHVDLIAGLPYEDKASFIKGFNRLLSLYPHNLQLGFLKMLKGSDIESIANEYVVSSFPPYEIYSSCCMSYDDILELKRVEGVLEVFYNSGKFFCSIRYMLSFVQNGYFFFLAMSDYLLKRGGQTHLLSMNRKCDFLFEFSSKYFDNINLDELEELISFDFTSSGNVRKWHKSPFSHNIR